MFDTKPSEKLQQFNGWLDPFCHSLQKTHATLNLRVYFGTNLEMKCSNVHVQIFDHNPNEAPFDQDKCLVHQQMRIWSSSELMLDLREIVTSCVPPDGTNEEDKIVHIFGKV